MRRIIVASWKISLVAVVCVGLAGCGMLEKEKATCGWRFEVMKPPTINTEMPVLIQSGPSLLSGQPVGSIAGPVTASGAFSHAGLVAAPAQVEIRSAVPPCVPLPPQTTPRAAVPQTLTCEEWCELMRQVQRRELLPPPMKEMPKPKEEE